MGIDQIKATGPGESKLGIWLNTAGVRISSGLGKHPNDEMFSFYMATPSGVDIEYGWGGLEIDDSVWQPKTFNQTSIWGHQPESTK